MRYNKAVVATAGILAMASSQAQIVVDNFTAPQLVTSTATPGTGGGGGILGGVRTVDVSGGAGGAFAGANLAGGGQGFLINGTAGTQDASFLYNAAPLPAGLAQAVNATDYFSFTYDTDDSAAGTKFTIKLSDGVNPIASWTSVGVLGGASGALIVSPVLSSFAGWGTLTSPIKSIELFIDVTAVGSDVAIDNLTLQVPEPSTYALLAGLGLVGFAGYRRFRS